MKRETILRKIPTRKSADDEFPEDLLIKAANLLEDEFESVFNRDLLTGRDLFEIVGGLDDYICLNNFIASQITNKDFVIIFAGRLDQCKGISYFITASKIVLDYVPNCHIIIAGNGDYDTCMKERRNRWMNIHFTGFLEKAELYELYSIADFGVMPSLHEQCSYTAIEMMMHALPIIASTSTGLSEMIVEGITGLHVPVRDYEDKVDLDISILAEKMLYMLNNENERNRMSKNARKRYLKFYSSKTMGEKMNNFYKKVLI